MVISVAGVIVFICPRNDGDTPRLGLHLDLAARLKAGHATVTTANHNVAVLAQLHHGGAVLAGGIGASGRSQLDAICPVDGLVERRLLVGDLFLTSFRIDLLGVIASLERQFIDGALAIGKHKVEQGLTRQTLALDDSCLGCNFGSLGGFDFSGGHFSVSGK